MAAGIPLISHITQANNRDFWLVDSNAVYGGLHHVDTIIDMYAINPDNIKNGMLCYVINEEEYYKFLNGNWVVWMNKEGTIVDDIITEPEVLELINIFNTDSPNNIFNFSILQDSNVETATSTNTVLLLDDGRTIDAEGFDLV